MPASTQLVSAEILARLHALDVAARAVVDGLHAGVHRSPFKGHSVDFVDHRSYVPGDDLRHLDWKVLARRDRLVLKRFEAETDLGCTLIVDASGSMAFAGERAPCNKYRYASILAASLAYLVIQQQDRAGLLIFDEERVQEYRPVRQGQLERICAALEERQPHAGTDYAKALDRLALSAIPRGLVLIVSDFLCDLAVLSQQIDRLRHRGHDIGLLWVLDREETDLDLSSVSRFQGLEGEGEIVAEPRALRSAYRAEVAEHRLAMERLSRSRSLALVQTCTDEAPHLALNHLLVQLQHR